VPYTTRMSSEPELRRDPICGRSVLVAPARATRPVVLAGANPRHRTNGDRHPCPFCPGQEHETPDELFALRTPGTAPNAPGWALRVVPNMYPAVRANAAAHGSAEVLIECAEHLDSPTELTADQLADVFRAYRERMLALATDARLEHVAVFKNVGAEAGASLGHTHSQLVATTFVPDLLRAELEGAESHFARTGRCAFCDLIARELELGERVIARTERFVALAAFAPRFAYEFWVLPVAHAPRYEALTDSEALELAGLVKRVLVALDVSQERPAYNWFVHTTPLRAGAPAHYHWHVEVVPRTSRPAGSEWGFGCHITTARPEVAAAELRAALPPE
jgi:UDPglucose--hexose-1-phosphate uridylyltransferase